VKENPQGGRHVESATGLLELQDLRMKQMCSYTLGMGVEFQQGAPSYPVIQEVLY